jgi:hypothetical protein
MTIPMKSHVGLFALLLGLSTITACSNDANAQVDWLSAHQSFGTANGEDSELPYCGTVRCPKCGYYFWRGYLTLTLCRANGPWVASNSCHPDPRWFCNKAYGVYNLCYAHCPGT